MGVLGTSSLRLREGGCVDVPVATRQVAAGIFISKVHKVVDSSLWTSAVTEGREGRMS